MRFGGVRCRWLAAAVVVALAGGCATVTYPGPRRPSSQVAIIEGRDLLIDWIDGMDVRGKRQRFEVLPGDHQLVVRLNYVKNYYYFSVRHYAEKPTGLCVIAQPGHYYGLTANMAGSLWEPVVLDGGSHIQAEQCRAEWR